MSLDALKKQAARLVAYLGANHRVNMKHASALEAIAAVHGARNWQTLAAGAPPAPEESSATATPRPGPGRPMALSRSDQGEPHVSLPQTAWLRHGIAFGDTAHAWMQDNLLEAAHAGLSAVLLGHPKDFAGMPQGMAPDSPVQMYALEDLGRLVSEKLSHLAVVAIADGRGWADLLRTSIRQRVITEERSPLVIGIPSLDEMTNEQVQHMLPLARQGRAVGITLRCHARSKHDLAARYEGTQFLAQMTHQLFLGDAREAAYEEVLERLKAAPAVYISGGVTQF